MLDDFHVASGTVLQQYKSNAKSRNLTFNLTKDDVKMFMASSCYYCGNPPSNTVRTFSGRVDSDREILYSGIDRLDNTKGYVLENCVACCYRCNWAKKDLTEEQFKSWIKRLYLNLFKKVTDKTPGELVDSLITADLKTWFAQEDALNESLSDEERTKAAERIHIYNNKRNKLMRSIDNLLGFEEDTVTEKTYNKFAETKEKELENE